MRLEMREAQKKEIMKKKLSEHKIYGDRCFEKWSKKPDVGKNMDKIYETNRNKARGLSIVLENQESHLRTLTETQISNAFQTTPENVIRIVRLAYANSIRSELFMEWAMKTSRDSIYYLHADYGSTARGGVQGERFIESPAYRYNTEMEEETAGTGDDSTVSFTGTLSNPPLRPYSVKIYVNEVPSGTDDGSGNLVGTGLSGTNTINYTTGAFEITFTAPPTAGHVILIGYNFDSEVESQYTDVKQVHLSLRDYQFRVKPHPLWFSYSKMTELLLGTTLGIDAEEAMVRGAGDELKKSLDFMALKMAYRYAKGNPIVPFDAQLAGGETRNHKATQMSEAFDNAGDAMQDDLQRGGMTVAFGSPKAVSFTKLHDRFNAGGAQPQIGAFKVGSIDNMGMYKAPKSLLEGNDNHIVAIYKNESVPEDVSLSFGTLIPFYKTQKIEYKNMYTEQGLAYFGDMKALQPKYLRIIEIDNL